MKKFIADNGLILSFMALFFLCLAGMVLTGATYHNLTLSQHGQPPGSTWNAVQTGEFQQGVFANWQAAILQLGTLIVFGVFLRQRGAPHSIDPDRTPQGVCAPDSDTPALLSPASAPPRPRPEGSAGSWLHDNSMSVVFGVLFVITFVLHALSGRAAYNATLALAHQPPLSLARFAVSSRFWFATFQTWEAEFMAMALYIFLSIVLRQKGSPESKPTGASNAATSEANK